MRGILGKFWRLPMADKLLLVEAWLMLGLARGGVLALSFTRVLRLFKGGGSATARGEADAAGVARVRRVARAIRVASRFTPWDSNCLAQALAASAMLRLRGLASVLYLGVARPGACIEAHAWLCSGGRFVCGETGHERYSVVSRF